MAEDNTTAYPIPPGKRRRKGAKPALEVLRGSLAGEVIPLEGGQVVLGKVGAADIGFPDTGVSRSHAKIVISSDGGISILDLASTNGTLVNDARIEVAVLRDGDRLSIGPEVVVRLVYRTEDEQEIPEATLSPRQLEVARLVAAGLTNARIAERLGLKTRTVTSHLDHIYARLGIGSRAALTRYIIEAGELPSD